MSENNEKKARALGINHVVLEVDDLDKALEFYGAIFDFKLRGKSDHNAFIDLGDQFIQLTLGRTQVADTKRHFGFVVDDREAVKRALDKLGVKSINDRLNILDPWGNRVEIVPYDDIQFTKADHILKGMGVGPLQKTSNAIEELKKKGMEPGDSHSQL
jgi:lactoylglutathione lyase